MEQTSMDFSAATAARNAGMVLAAEHAEAVSPGWKESAYQFLRDFARTHEKFISENVSDAHIAAGLEQPPTLKAWGSIYQKAAKAGLIARVGFEISRRRHLSPTPLWASQIFGMAS